MSEQVLTRCGAIWCEWQARQCVASCPYRGGEAFRYAYCRLFSTPGPHSDSRISKVVGESMATVKDAARRGELKLRRELADDALDNDVEDKTQEVA